MFKKKREYIWYCPRKKSCGAIIFKTTKPFLDDDEAVVRCRRCNELITFKALELANKHNLKKYTNEFDNE